MSLTDAGFIGGLLGAILLSVWTLLCYALFARRAMNDGQFCMIFMWILPFGGMLGFVTGQALSLVHMRETRAAGWVCTVGGAIIAGLSFLFALGLSSMQRQNPKTIRDSVLSLAANLCLPFMGIPFPWALLLIAWGWRLLEKR